MVCAPFFEGEEGSNCRQTHRPERNSVSVSELARTVLLEKRARENALQWKAKELIKLGVGPAFVCDPKVFAVCLWFAR